MRGLRRRTLELMPIEPVGVFAAGCGAARGAGGEGRAGGSLTICWPVVRRTREWPTVSLGASPRASASLMVVAKGYAARDGRDFLIPDDVKLAAAASAPASAGTAAGGGA